MAQVTWTSTNDGTWATGANWSGGVAPMSSDDVVVAAASSGLLTLSGPGNAASLTTYDLTALTGTFATGVVTIGTSSLAASIQLNAGSSLAANSVNVVDGQVNVAAAGASLAVTGTLTVGNVQGLSSAGGSLQVSGGAVQVGNLVLAPSGSSSVTVGQGGSLEIGNAGGTVVGTVTVDSGSFVSGTGTIAAPSIVDNGTIIAQGGSLTLGGAITGSGSLQVGASGTLVLGSNTGAVGVAFADATGTLQLAEVSNGTLSTGGAISGLVAGDVIKVVGPTAVTSVIYAAQSTGAGTLSLMNGQSTVGTLSLSGAYGASTFHVAASSQLGTDITVTMATDPLFDATYYLSRNPDVAAAGIDAFQHYLSNGWHEGRNPDAFFDSNYYLTANPDVRAAGVNPLLHFEAYGWREGRDPSLVFSDGKYLAANPDVAAAGVNPLQHYIQSGRSEGRSPNLTGSVATADPLVDPSFYDAQLGSTLIPPGLPGAQQASFSFNDSGWQQGLNPDAFFNTTYYLASNPDVAAAHIDPLTHYEAYGWHEGRNPSALFSSNQYLAANTDVAAAGVNPLLHYVSYGQAEGRAVFHV